MSEQAPGSHPGDFESSFDFDTPDKGESSDFATPEGTESIDSSFDFGTPEDADYVIPESIDSSFDFGTSGEPDQARFLSEKAPQPPVASRRSMGARVLKRLTRR